MLARRKYLLILAASLSTASRAPVCNFGVSFSPAGLLTPYHIGASACLHELGLIHPQIGLAGSSGGALAAITSSLLLEDTKEDKLAMTPLESSVYVAQQCRELGARGTLKISLETVLQKLVPEDAHILLNNRPSPVRISFTEINGNGLQGHLIDRFISKKDVIDCLLASCNIPFYFNDQGLFVNCRGLRCVDGFFAVDIRRFGCPVTGATKRELLICPYRRSLVSIYPEKVRPSDSQCQYDIITPDFLDEKTWPFTVRDVIQMSFTAPESSINPDQPISDEELRSKYDLLYAAGFESVKRWYDQEGSKTWAEAKLLQQ